MSNQRRPLFIAHRGNRNGPNPEHENKESYIIEAVADGCFAEVDVWFKPEDQSLWLGHDNPQYKTTATFLQNPCLFCHAKTVETMALLEEMGVMNLWI